jgi:hypothetical protein
MITDADGQLAARFAAIRDNTDDSDWADVLRRRPARRSTPTRLLVAVLALIVVGIPVSLAFGGVRAFFFGTPAPPIVKRAFSEQTAMFKMLEKWERAHHAHTIITPPNVNGKKAHGVIAVRTPDGPLLLWAAPAGHGRECWFIDFARDQVGRKQPLGGGACDGVPPQQKIGWDYGESSEHPTLKVISGRLYVNAVSIDVTASNKDTGKIKTYRLPVVQRFFLAAFSRSTKTPTRLVARNAQGKVVATFTRPAR